jgi:hypothetical protein
MKSKNNNNNNDDDDDDDDDNNTAMGSVHAWGDTFLTFGLKALTEMNTSRLATEAATFTFNSIIIICILHNEINPDLGSFRLQIYTAH